MAPLRYEYFDCQCHDFNHTIRLTLDPQDGDVYLDVRLNDWMPWHRRIWNAVKYIFKYDVTDGHYDVTLLREEDHDRIRDILRQSEISRANLRSAVREHVRGEG